MKLVLTLPLRDTDLADAQIAYHLNAGVDLVLASGGVASGILESYERGGYLQAVGEGTEWRTRAARLAATEHGADWVINAEPGEFWWPRGESLKDVLAPIPPRYTIIQGLRREFVAQTEGDGVFSETMTVRGSLQEGSNDRLRPPADLLRPVHRADPQADVREDGTVWLTRNVPLRAWYPIEVFRFPARADSAPPAAGVGRLVSDTRLRDALRALETGENAPGLRFALPQGGVSRFAFPTPDIVDDASYAIECAAVREVDLARLEAYVTQLEQRIGWLEERLWPRMLRVAGRVLHRQGR